MLNVCMQAAKRILEEHKAVPIAVLGRYAGAYTHITKVDWWDYDLCGGPIVEQVTPCHFINIHTPDRK